MTHRNKGSTGSAFASTSSCASACHHTSTSGCAPLALLVVAFSSVSASPSCHASCQAPRPPPFIMPQPFITPLLFGWFFLAPCPRSLVVTPPVAASCCTPLVWLVCRIARRLGLSYGWLLCCLSSRRCLLRIYASRS